MKLFDTPRNFTMLAKDGEKRSLEQMLSVDLPQARLVEFRRTFHPRATRPGAVFYTYLTYITDVNHYVNSLFHALRQVAFNGDMVNRSPAQIGLMIQSEWELNYSRSGTAQEAVSAETAKFVKAMADGFTHVIWPSRRFKEDNGMDIAFIGTRGATEGSAISLSNRASFVPEDSRQQTAQNFEKLINSYTTGKNLVKFAKDLQKLLFGQKYEHVSGNSYLRTYNQKRVGALTESHIRTVIEASDLFKSGVEFKSPKLSTPIDITAFNTIEKYFSLLCIKEPLSGPLNTKARTYDIPDEMLNVSELALALNIQFSCGFSINLPGDFVQYITQSKTKPSLFALNIWVNSWARSTMRIPGKKYGGLLKPHRIPQYVLLPSKSIEITEKRKSLGFYTEPGKVNEDNLCVSDVGTLTYIPKAESVASLTKNAKEFEDTMEELLATTFEAGCPFNAINGGSVVYNVASPSFRENAIKQFDKLQTFKGKAVAINWDLNAVVTVSEDPQRLHSEKLLGYTAPNELNLENFLTMPFGKALQSLQDQPRIIIDGKSNLAKSDSYVSAENFSSVEAISLFFAMYTQLAKAKLVALLPTLIAKAANDFGIKSLSDESVSMFETQHNGMSIYMYWIPADFKLGNDHNDPERIGEALKIIMDRTLMNASASPHGTVVRYSIKENVELADIDRYLDLPSLKLEDFAGFYKWFGGRVLYHAFKEMLNAPQEELIRLCSSEVCRFTKFSKYVMPVITTLTKYVFERREEIRQKAEELEEKNRNPEISGDELAFPGVAEKFALFPHQVNAMRLLNNEPRFAVIDVDPGGGKTIMGLCDMANLYYKNRFGESLPWVLCPSGLVKNWIEDCHKIFNAKFNVIAITSESYNAWGDEKLTKLIQTAPKNTLVVLGFSFLSRAQKTQLVIGNSVEDASEAVEFAKKFKPAYVLIDESHRLKSMRTGTHKAAKSLIQISSIKYIREATGTFILNNLSDAVGQASIFSGQIFGTRDSFDEMFKEDVQGPNGKVIQDYGPDAPKAVRARLSRFATVITARRKEWAFMLPTPIETFIPVHFQENLDDEVGRRLRMFYDAVLNQTLEELRNNKMIMNIAKGGSDDDDDDEALESTIKKGREVSEIGGKNIDVSEGEEDEENLDALEAALQPYLQRLERILTDPFGDEDLFPVAQSIFGKDFDYENYVTPKVKKIIERINKHYESNPWKKGQKYDSCDIVDFGETSYVFRPWEPVRFSQGVTSLIEPNKDPENWLEQNRGKVIVFCRYTRSVEAVYRALPASLREKAVQFHGQVGDKWGNLDDFKSSPKVSILIANEMAISEGHNLQAATRSIRAESPWSPGELDQSDARMFRPDVENKFRREIIFKDYLICDNSLEVCKFGRLISRMLKKTQFDEAKNEKYYQGLNPLNLPIIKMSLTNIAELNSINDLCQIGGEGSTSEIHGLSYLGQYRNLVRERNNEFKEMKATLPSTMQPIEALAMPKESGQIDFYPWIANMKVPDRYNEGLALLRTSLDEEDHPIAKSFARDKDSLIGLSVRTEFGMGTIEALRMRNVREADDEEGLGISALSKVKVRLDQGGFVTLSPSKIYVALNLSEKARKNASKNAPKIGMADKERTADAAKRLNTALSAKPKKKVSEDLPSTKKKVEKVLSAEFFPIVYNGFLALEAITEDVDDLRLKKFGFERFGDYAFIMIPNKKEYDAILDWVDEKVFVDDRAWKRLESFEDSFATGRGRKFQVEQASASEFPMFYTTNHRLVKVSDPKRPNVKMYPVINNEKLMFVVDLDTNPAFKKFLNKKIKNSTKVFKQADGLDIQFFSNKRDLKSKVKEMMREGVDITNLDTLNDEIDELDLKALQKSK